MSSLTFNWYIKPGGSNTDIINRQLQNARMQIIQNAADKGVSGKINGKTTLKQFEDDLNALFYPKTNNSQYQQIVSQLNNIIAQRYDEVADKTLAKFNLTDQYYTVANTTAFGPEFWERVEKIQNKISRKENISFKIAWQYIDKINAIIDGISKKSNLNNIQSDIQFVKYTLMPEFEGFVNQAFIDAGYDLQKDLNKMLISKRTGYAEYETDWINTFKLLEAIVIALTTVDGKPLLTTEEYGTTLELGLYELGNVIRETGDILSDKLLQRLSGGLLGNGYTAWTGRTSVERGGRNLSMHIDSSLISNKELRYEKDKKTSNVYVEINTDPKLVIQYNESQSEDKAAGKMDVNFSYNDQQLRISAKNWGYNVSDKNNFGDTSLLAGLNRSLSSVAKLQGYTMALQYPYWKKDGTEYDDATNKLQTAHDLAKTALIADILMGYSQQQGYANCVVVHQRGKKFTVIDIVGIMRSLINANKIDKLPYMQLEGYNETDLEYTARNVRKFILNKKHTTFKTGNYYSIMWNYFKAQQIVLRVKTEYFK